MDKTRVKQGVRVHRPNLPGDPHGTITRQRLSGRWSIKWDYGQESAFDPDGDIEVELAPKTAGKVTLPRELKRRRKPKGR